MCLRICIHFQIYLVVVVRRDEDVKRYNTQADQMELLVSDYQKMQLRLRSLEAANKALQSPAGWVNLVWLGLVQLLTPRGARLEHFKPEYREQTRANFDSSHRIDISQKMVQSLVAKIAQLEAKIASLTENNADL